AALGRADLSSVVGADPPHGRERSASTRHRAPFHTRSRDAARDQSDDGVEGLQPPRSRRSARAQPRQTDDDREGRSRSVTGPEATAAARAALGAARARGASARARRKRRRESPTQYLGENG